MTSKRFGGLINEEKKALMGAWVDGETIEYLSYQGRWEKVTAPKWLENIEYRIKPKPPVVKTFSVFGGWYDASKTYMYFDTEDEGESCEYKITLTMIDGVVQPNALVEVL